MEDINIIPLEHILLSEIRERQIPYDLTYMWNLKIKTNKQIKQNRNRAIDIENKLMIAKRGGEVGWVDEINE